MIQEKDFLYRVPVKTAPITTPKGQIRNPEILVDIDGGEFMHGNILDANSTNKLINQSVKDAVDNKIIEGGYVTKDLLNAETSARTNGDEDLSTKIKAEQTRAEGKEKEISDKLAIVDGDSNTEGSFRKAIADVIAAAPEDLDTLKEIADKLADSDDLHTALNQAITEKADTSALANEVTRATGVESNLQAAIDAKQDAGNYIPYDNTDMLSYKVDRTIKVSGENGYTTLVENNANLSIGYSNSILTRPFWKFGLQGAEFNSSDGKKRIDIQGVGSEYANIFGIKLSTNVQNSSGTWDDPCQIQNNSDYVLFSKKIKVSDIITDSTTDSSLNTVLSKKVDTETFNNFTSSTLSTFSGQIALKQDKITPTAELDLTSIDTADIDSLRSIVKALATELNTLGLIKLKSAEEAA